jgi:SagB-type dehydrogenase family enzyme
MSDSPRRAPDEAPLAESASYRYHRLSKLSIARVMSEAWVLDWANQPDPFRRYEGAPLIALPRDLLASDENAFDVLLRAQGAAAPSRASHPPGVRFLSHLLYYSLAISAWKEIAGTEHRWSLRVNPSSGNLHPTEAHVVCRGVHDVEDGVYHYAVREHALERRATGSVLDDLWRLVAPAHEPVPPIVVVLTSIFWREAWKYRHRAYRYCNHDAGHAAAAVLVSAAALGWRGEMRGRFPDGDVEAVLGLSGGDERPLLIVPLRPDDATVLVPPARPAPRSPLRGTPNVISPEVLRYETIDEAHEAGNLTLALHRAMRPPLPGTLARSASLERPVRPPISALGIDARREAGAPLSIHRVVRQRRSAVDHDGVAWMPAPALFASLWAATRGWPSDFLSPAGGPPRFFVQLFVYVHRVLGVDPGLYAYDRVSQALALLRSGDQKSAAAGLSLGQEIAADACFAISMVADLEAACALHGDRGYRLVHHEAGAIGQMLYLAAEALGFEATGIGAFFDDDANRYLSVQPGREVIYHFCTGRAVLDPRLTSRPPYDFPDPALDPE